MIYLIIIGLVIFGIHKWIQRCEYQDQHEWLTHILSEDAQILREREAILASLDDDDD